MDLHLMVGTSRCEVHNRSRPRPGCGDSGGFYVDPLCLIRSKLMLQLCPQWRWYQADGCSLVLPALSIQHQTLLLPVQPLSQHPQTSLKLGSELKS